MAGQSRVLESPCCQEAVEFELLAACQSLAFCTALSGPQIQRSYQFAALNFDETKDKVRRISE